MIYYRIPWSDEKRLDLYYTREMGMLPDDDDWCCFVDGDAMFTTYDYGAQIRKTVEQNPEYGLFTCLTNRVHPVWQLVPGLWDYDDMVQHREWGQQIQDRNKSVLDITNSSPMSGVMILWKKSAWKKIGQIRRTGMLAVDNSIHIQSREAGIKVGLIRSVYLYHWYRGGDKGYTDHLK